MTHICVSNSTISGRRQATIWTNAGILLIRPLGTNSSELLIEIHTFSFKKMHLKMLSGKWQPLCLGLNVLNLRALNFQCFITITSLLFCYECCPIATFHAKCMHCGLAGVSTNNGSNLQLHCLNNFVIFCNFAWLCSYHSMHWYCICLPMSSSNFAV